MSCILVNINIFRVPNANKLHLLQLQDIVATSFVGFDPKVVHPPRRNKLISRVHTFVENEGKARAVRNKENSAKKLSARECDIIVSANR